MNLQIADGVFDSAKFSGDKSRWINIEKVEEVINDYKMHNESASLANESISVIHTTSTIVQVFAVLYIVLIAICIIFGLALLSTYDSTLGVTLLTYSVIMILPTAMLFLIAHLSKVIANMSMDIKKTQENSTATNQYLAKIAALLESKEKS